MLNNEFEPANVKARYLWKVKTIWRYTNSIISIIIITFFNRRYK